MTIVSWVLFAAMLAALGFAIYLAIANMVNAIKAETTPSEYDIRKKEYMSNMDTRQYQYMDDLKGASLTEVVGTLEARIYDLEQRLAASERRNQDDGK